MPLTALPQLSPPAVDLRDGGAAAYPLLPMLTALAEALDAAGVKYCQWKGHFKRDRWAAGVGDVDLLVERRSEARFVGLLTELGFKLAVPPAEQQIPGVLSYVGLDLPTGQLVHLHVHYRLVIGGFWRTTYRVPIEQAVLDSAVPTDVFRIPAPELEFVLFVLRQVQRYTIRDALREPPWLPRVQGECRYLEERVDGARVNEQLARHLPEIPAGFFQRARASLARGGASWERARLRHDLHRHLRAHVRRPLPLTRLAFLLREVMTLRGRIGARMSTTHLATGGAIIALAGADGAGKSTCARDLVGWLSPYLRVAHAHLGKPRRSLTTLVVGAALKGARLGERWLPALTRYLEQLRCVATARDRYLLYEKVRRVARNGALAVCERYPIPEDSLVGPAIARGLPPGALSTALTRLLLRVERRYYDLIVPPDLLVVLRVDPVTAVRRKTTEPADYVRERARTSSAIDWTKTGAHIVDAARPFPDVIAELKAHIWSEV